MAMIIPLVVSLWENVGCSGRKRVVVEDTPNLVLQVFNDKASAITVEKGPDYQSWKTQNPGKEPVVALYEHVNYGGAVMTLPAGTYSNIHALYNFGDMISSARINPPEPGIGTVSPIPLVVELFADANYMGYRFEVVNDCPDIPAAFGSEFNDVVTSVRVKQGPNYAPGKMAQLFRDVNYMGGKIELEPGNYPNIGSSHGFNDVVSSIKVR